MGRNILKAKERAGRSLLRIVGPASHFKPLFGTNSIAENVLLGSAQSAASPCLSPGSPTPVYVCLESGIQAWPHIFSSSNLKGLLFFPVPQSRSVAKARDPAIYYLPLIPHAGVLFTNSISRSLPSQDPTTYVHAPPRLTSSVSFPQLCSSKSAPHHSFHSPRPNRSDSTRLFYPRAAQRHVSTASNPLPFVVSLATRVDFGIALQSCSCCC